MSEWIEWNGGECPVPANMIVEVVSRIGPVTRDRARNIHWKHRKFRFLPYQYWEIIRYRVVDAVQETPKEKVMTDHAKLIASLELAAHHNECAELLLEAARAIRELTASQTAVRVSWANP